MSLRKAITRGLGRITEATLTSLGQELGQRVAERLTRRWKQQDEDSSESGKEG